MVKERNIDGSMNQLQKSQSRIETNEFKQHIPYNNNIIAEDLAGHGHTGAPNPGL